MNRIPVFATVREAVWFSARNFRRFAVAGAVPVALYLGAVLPLAVIGSETEDLLDWPTALEPLSEVLLVPLFVAWHRATLGIETSPARWVPRLDHPTLRYGTLMLAMSLVSILMMLIWSEADKWVSDAETETLTPVVLFGGIIAFTFATYIWLYLRIAFVRVELAIGRGADLRAPWRLTRGRCWNLLWIGALVLSPSIGIQILHAFIENDPGGNGLIWDVIEETANILTLAVWVSAITIAYRHATGWNPPAPEGATPT